MKTQPPQSSSPHRSPSRIRMARDTVESFAGAFIFALVFKAFIVESFVIPTGSMAVTLYGDHVASTCPVCGYEFARGIDAGEHASAASLTLRCQNCDSAAETLSRGQIINPGTGDRILVHRWHWDIGGTRLGPHRWDVTVFKDPTDGQTNFIKRMVGMPGEVLEIVDGDVFTAPLAELRKARPELETQFEELRLKVYEWGRSRQGSTEEIQRRYAELNQELLPFLHVRRKLRESHRAQQSLWVNVYDHDFLPHGMGKAAGAHGGVGWHPMDEAARAVWNTAQSEITFKPTGPASPQPEPLYIRFAGKPVNDYSAYDSPTYLRALNIVGDIRLRFTWFPDKGDGGIVLQTNRDEAVFTARINTDGSAELRCEPGAQARAPAQSGKAENKHCFDVGDSAIAIEFMHVDGMARLIVDGKTLDLTYDLDPAGLLARRTGDSLENFSVKPTEVRIGALGVAGRLRHVKLERDVYYRGGPQLEQANTQRTPNPYFGWPGWATAGMPILLRDEHFAEGRRRAGEYLMLGDNSPASKDSRYWWEIGPHLRGLGSEYARGTVPADQLIGEAFFVYWPAGYRRAWTRDIGLIPNVGRMRWIR